MALRCQLFDYRDNSGYFKHALFLCEAVQRFIALESPRCRRYGFNHGLWTQFKDIGSAAGRLLMLEAALKCSRLAGFSGIQASEAADAKGVRRAFIENISKEDYERFVSMLLEIMTYEELLPARSRI